MKKLSFQTLRNVLTGLEEGLSYSQITQRTQTSKASVSRIAQAADQTGQSTKQWLALSDSELISLIYPPSPLARTEPDWASINTQLKRKNVTKRLLYERYLAQAGVTPYNYSSFCRRLAQWRLDNGLVSVGGNVERVPGQRMEIDFAGDLLPWIDGDGCIQHCKLFVAALPYSNMMFTEAFSNEKQPSWIAGIVDALEYFGAVPECLVMDNALALVNRDGWREGNAHPAIKSLCLYYGMEPWVCKPATPQQKSRVEAAVHAVERWIIAELTLDQPLVASDLQDVNEQVRKRFDAINGQPFRGRNCNSSRREIYEQQEKAHMRALPGMPYEPGEWRVLTVDKAHCVRIASEAGHRYSVPVTYIGKSVAVRIARNTVEIYDKDTHKVLGIHKRCTNVRGDKTHILREHLTPAEKHYRRTAEDWVNTLVHKGLPRKLATEFVVSLKDNKGGFPSGRICGSVCGLFNTYPPATICKAIGSALEDRVFRARYIKELCEQYQFALTTNRTLDLGDDRIRTSAPIMHKNLRGNYK